LIIILNLENSEAVKLFSNCIAKLKFAYDPDQFKNPAIEKLWSEIEAVALDRTQTEEFVDVTLPDHNNKNWKRVEDFLSQLTRKIVLKLIYLNKFILPNML